MSRRRLFSKLDSAGDTIVEVLLAIAIVSVTLGAAYVAANRSLRATRLSQERGEALKYAESQVEMLRAYITHNDDRSPAQGTDKCITGVTSVSNTPCKKGPDNRYSISTSYLTTAPATYRINVIWDAYGGGEEQKVTLYYRQEI